MMPRFCQKEMQEYVQRGWDCVEVTVKCGNTSPDGSPYMCERCAKLNEGTNWRQEALENGENWDESDY